MRKFLTPTHLSVFIVLMVVIFLAATQVSAAPSNNPIFTTVERVMTIIEEAMIPLRKENAIVQDRVESLEVWVNNQPTQPQCATCTAEIAVKAVNEEVAIDALRSIQLAQAKFKKDDTDGNGTFDYAPAMDDLLESGNLIDNVLGTGTKRGYQYQLQLTPNQQSWFAVATPIKPGKTGDRSFYVDETGVIRFEASGSATPQSPPLEN